MPQLRVRACFAFNCKAGTCIWPREFGGMRGVRCVIVCEQCFLHRPHQNEMSAQAHAWGDYKRSLGSLKKTMIEQNVFIFLFLFREVS